MRNASILYKICAGHSHKYHSEITFYVIFFKKYHIRPTTISTNTVNKIDKNNRQINHQPPCQIYLRALYVDQN